MLQFDKTPKLLQSTVNAPKHAIVR